MKMQIERCSGALLAFTAAALCWSGTATQAAAQQCAVFPSGYVPFTQVYTTQFYPVNPGFIAVGAMTSASYSEMLSSVPLPSSQGQTFCFPIQLAPNDWVIAYVPTAAERLGDFSYFLSVQPSTQLYDPLNGNLLLNNQFPPDSGFFFWHVAAQAQSPSATTLAMISRVNALYSQGLLNSGQDNSLVKELQKAFDMMNSGKINGAIGNLESFISEVQDLESSGALTSDQATVLIHAADIVIAELTEES